MQIITSIFDFLNRNAGAITAVATALLAILTAIYVGVTRKLAKEAKRQADLLLSERKSLLHRELTEKIYVPLSKALIPLSECIYRENPPVYDEWSRIRENMPFLAYRINNDLFEKLEALTGMHYSYFISYRDRSKELESIIRDRFPTSTSTTKFWFFYDKEKSFNISYLQIIFSELELIEHIKLMARTSLHLQEIDEKLFEYAETYPLRHIEPGLNLDEFKKLWDEVKNEIQEHRGLSNWLSLKQEMASRSTDILEDLEELISSGSDNAV